MLPSNQNKELGKKMARSTHKVTAICTYIADKSGFFGRGFCQ